MRPERLCGSRHLAIGKPKAQTELSTAAYSRNEAGAVLSGCISVSEPNNKLFDKIFNGKESRNG